jgi:BirA family biotin operon repressor/biotin-[acetyl-CoA-carboxylase] ligase
MTVHWWRSAGSTNDVVRELARTGAPHGMAVATDTQTGGRGRLGRTWVMPPGAGLALSILVRRLLPPNRVPLVCFAAAVATADACGPTFRIKWPNDVVHPERKKVAGILAEAEWEGGVPAWVVVGIGVNVREAPPLDTATSLASHGATPDLRDLADRITRDTLAWIDMLGEQPATLLDAWRARAWLGARVRIGELEGVGEDVDDDGALLVRNEAGVTKVTAGDVHIVGGW